MAKNLAPCPLRSLETFVMIINGRFRGSWFSGVAQMRVESRKLLAGASSRRLFTGDVSYIDSSGHVNLCCPTAPRNQMHLCLINHN